MQSYDEYKKFLDDLHGRQKKLRVEIADQEQELRKAEQSYRDALADARGADEAKERLAEAKERLAGLRREKAILELVPVHGSPRLAELADGVKAELRVKMDVVQAEFDRVVEKAKAARQAYIESLTEVGAHVAEGRRLESLGYRVSKHLQGRRDVPTLRGEALFSRELAIGAGEQQTLFNGRG